MWMSKSKSHTSGFISNIFRGWNADNERELIEALASNLGQQEVSFFCQAWMIKKWKLSIIVKSFKHTRHEARKRNWNHKLFTPWSSGQSWVSWGCTSQEGLLWKRGNLWTSGLSVFLPVFFRSSLFWKKYMTGADHTEKGGDHFGNTADESSLESKMI